MRSAICDTFCMDADSYGATEVKQFALVYALFPLGAPVLLFDILAHCASMYLKHFQLHKTGLWNYSVKQPLVHHGTDVKTFCPRSRTLLQSVHQVWTHKTGGFSRACTPVCGTLPKGPAGFPQCRGCDHGVAPKTNLSFFLESNSASRDVLRR